MTSKAMLKAGVALAVCLAGQPSLTWAADKADQALLDAVRKADASLAISLAEKHQGLNTRDETGATPLLWATQRQDGALIKALLEGGADPNIATHDGINPLQLAISTRQFDSALAMLQHKAKVDVARETGETALMTAARAGDFKVFKDLVDRGADVNAHENRFNQTVLMWAAGRPEFVKVLLEHGADIKARTKTWDVATTIYTPQTSTIGVTGIPWNNDGQYTAKQGGQNALFFAIQQDSPDSVKTLLDAGVDVNEPAADGTTPLLASLYKWKLGQGKPPGNGGGVVSDLVYAPNVQVASLLLDRGAKIEGTNASGYTVLHAAVLALIPKAPGRGGRGGAQAPAAAEAPADTRPALDLVKRVLDLGASPNAKTVYPTGGPVGNVRVNPAPPASSPLHIAALSRNTALMEMLIARGGDPNQVRNDGNTPLTIAVKANDLALVKTLAAHGGQLKALYNTQDYVSDPVKPISRPRTNQTLLHMAAIAPANDVIPFLVQSGVPVNLKNGQGETALQLADEQERFRFVRAVEGRTSRSLSADGIVRETATTDLMKKLLSQKSAGADVDAKSKAIN